MRVLLVNPPPFQRVDRYDTPDFVRLGLASLAGQLRHDRTCDVGIVDAKFERLGYADVVERVRGARPDVVGLTAFTNEIKPAARVARMIKAISPSIVTVIGGTHVTALPRETLVEFPEFDIGVVGEGEITFRELLVARDRGTRLAAVAGLVHREEGAPALTEERERIVDQDEIPAPAWDLLPASPRYLFMTQRGCPFRCTFCANPNGRVVRKRSVDRVIDELRYLIERFAPRELYVCDEVFTSEPERTHALLDAMIAAHIGDRLRWSAQTHVNMVDREIFRKMKAAGCFIVGLGIETGDPEIMRRMRKGITRERVLEARRAARSVGLAVESLMIIGHPNETWQSAMRTIDFAAELDPERPIFGVMVPYPGTHVADLARRGEGGYRLLSKDWNDYNKQIGDAMEFENLSRRDLEALQMRAYLHVFVKNKRWSDLARFAWEYRSEGWAVVDKLLLGRKPPPVEVDDEPARVSPYFDGVQTGRRRSLPVTG
ncbi:MAG TPA: radical SAM protein [Galbitalea sp.]|jgi:radical SAM superfamily enzyme YgiQ (UPF0313 family)|nr:radical SAM protein [Galbitalea sp.]